jgi:uncharacterized Zn-binding protein involved in type VI secretion
MHPNVAVAHPALPLAIISGSPTVMINNLPAARVSDKTVICSLPTCVPNGPGVIAKGSATVMINSLAAARQGDASAHTGCAAPIPSPTGKILPPCSPTVIIGG